MTLGPSGVANSAGEMPRGHEVGDGDVFQAEPVVGLDELAGDAMEEGSTRIGHSGVLAGTPPDRPGPMV